METEMSDTELTTAQILERPYHRVVVRDDDGSYFAEISEFPNCFASGTSPANALEVLDEVAAEWIAAALENDQIIPEPFVESDYSGKFVVRITKSLHKQIAQAADRDGVSLNHYVATVLARDVGSRMEAKAITALGSITVNAISAGIEPSFSDLKDR